MQRLHAIIEGYVQGVNFRANTKQRAEQRRITGWVRNNADGTVEVLAEGETAQLEGLLRYLHDGPPTAEVRSVKATWQEATGEFNDFYIAY